MLAYFDCFSGISGDMTLGALIDLGIPPDWLQQKLADLPLEGFHLDVKRVHRNGIGATQVEVVCQEGAAERSYQEIKALIENGAISDSAKAASLGIFSRLAEAEAGIHGCEVEAVHFHEVGATDAIVDIVGAVLGLEYLQISAVRASKLTLGSGFVTCRHGRIPVPAPATLALLKNVPVAGTEVAAELVTPTGAAILTGLAENYGTLPSMRIRKIGYGAGQRELTPGPNLLRVIIGSREEKPAASAAGTRRDQVWILETTIDDMNPELLGYCMDRLFDDGALDVILIPVQMKKNRPGTILQAICHAAQKKAVMDRILTETTTLGVRQYRVDRYILEREEIIAVTSYGKVAVKRIQLLQGGVRVVPEYEVCRKIAQEKNIPLRTVYDTIAREVAE